MDRREAIKMGAAAVAAVTVPGAVVEAFDKEKEVAQVGPSDTLILECKNSISPHAREAIDATWRSMRRDNPSLPKMILFDGGLTLAGVIKGGP